MFTHIAGNTLDAVLTKDYDNNFIANMQGDSAKCAQIKTHLSDL